MGKLIDLTGKRFGLLTVISYAGLDGGKNAEWNCECECGNSCVVRGYRMRDGTTASCGCLVSQTALRSSVVRGDGSIGKGAVYRATYSTWSAMKARCYNARHPFFPRYGGRGISVCSRWKSSFENFLSDMGLSPFPGAELDRVDNDGCYSPENCRWTTTKENSRNRRSNRVIETPDGMVPVWKASEISGLSSGCLLVRVKNNWPADRLFEKPRPSKRGFSSRKPIDSCVGYQPSNTQS